MHWKKARSVFKLCLRYIRMYVYAYTFSRFYTQQTIQLVKCNINSLNVCKLPLYWQTLERVTAAKSSSAFQKNIFIKVFWSHQPTNIYPGMYHMSNPILASCENIVSFIHIIDTETFTKFIIDFVTFIFVWSV